jgi:chromodomain-helicase-DNA-binding protein 1
MASHSLTNGHSSPLAINVAPASQLSPPSESELSDVKENVVEAPSSDEDAPGEAYDEDDEMQIDSDSSEDVDAEGEPDGDYDSETPPPVQVESSRARSSTSQESRRPPKRKASVEEDDFMTQNPELYGLRRSVRTSFAMQNMSLTEAQGRARPTRRIVRYSYQMEMHVSNRI